MKISIVTPCYNEESNIENFYNEISKIYDSFPSETEFEIIYVDDGSSDNTYNKIINIANANSEVKYITFSRNFGKEAAMLAGLEASCGDYVVVMDVDLQDPPTLIPEMYEYISTGKYDRIATRRTNRKGEPPIRSFFSKCFYKIINKISKVKIVDGARDYSMMSRRMVNSVLQLKERSRFTKGLFEWPGYKTKWLSFENQARTKGRSKWSFFSLLSYSIEGIVSFSSHPLIISSLIGFSLFILSFIVIILVIVRKILFGDPVSGWPSLVCIILFISGLQHFSIGILGTYLSRIFTEVKGRPLYVVLESNIEKE